MRAAQDTLITAIVSDIVTVMTASLGWESTWRMFRGYALFYFCLRLQWCKTAMCI